MAHEYWCGLHLVDTALNTHQTQILVLYVDAKTKNPRVIQLRERAESVGIPVEAVGENVLQRWTSDTHHQGIVAKVRLESPATDLSAALAQLDMEKKPVILALEGLQDPHNLGACLRSAAGFGVSLVMIPAHRSVGVTPTVRKIACGGAEQVPVVVVSNFVRSLEVCKEAGFWAVGTSLKTNTSVENAAWTRPIVVVMGAEEVGLREHTEAACDELVCIPLQPAMQSLNVSVATGITLYAIDAARRK